MKVKVLLGIQNTPHDALIESRMIILDSLLDHIAGKLVATQLQEILLQNGQQLGG